MYLYYHLYQNIYCSCFFIVQIKILCGLIYIIKVHFKLDGKLYDKLNLILFYFINDLRLHSKYY